MRVALPSGMRLLLIALLTTTGCGINFGDSCSPSGCPDGTGGAGGGGGGGGAQNISTLSVSAAAPYRAPAVGAALAPVAAGGATDLRLYKSGVTGVEVVADAPVAITRTSTSANAETFRVTTQPTTPASFGYSVLTNQLAPVEGTLATEAVQTVELVPSAARYRRATDGPLAFTKLDRNFVIEISGSQPLVDTSLSVTGAQLLPLAWDRFTLPATLGSYELQVTGSSFGARTVEVEVVGTIDRIESIVEGTQVAGEPVTVCFFAYHGDREVYVPLTIEGDVVPADGANCIDTKHLQPGTYSYSATALTVTGNAVLTIQ